MRKLFFAMVFMLTCVPLARADFMDSTPVGPGIIHYHEYREMGPWHLNVLEIDLSNEWIHLQTAKADDRLAGYERTSSMAGRNDHEEHRVVGATNGDFYASGGIPTGAQVLAGELLKEPNPSRSVLGTTPDNRPCLDVVTFSGQLLAADGSPLDVDGVNRTRGTDEFILYNQYYGSTTGTNYWGTEIIAEYLTEQIALNDTIALVATAKDSVQDEGHGNNAIPSNGIVISGHGLSRDFLNEHVFVGDTLSLILRLPPLSDSIVELIGGGPRLIRDGRQSFASDRHPRTAAGFSQDSTKLYLFTVDGRQAGYSIGMSLYELADYLLEWGVYQGFNLDGGGSTTMVVRGQVVNSPSDAGGERSVANALMVISKAPTGPLAVLRIDPAEAYALAETQIQFSAAGFDQHYNSVAVNQDSLKWSCDVALGAIDENGLFTAGSDQISGYVYAREGGVRDSALVHITDIASIELFPNPVILEVGEQQEMSPQTRDSFGNLIELSVTDYGWSVMGTMGEISAQGVFTATQPGEGYILASYQAVVGSVAVSVGVPTDVILDDFGDLSNWSLTGTLVDLSECSLVIDSAQAVSPPSSAKLHYSLQTGGTSALYMNCSLPISGTPDAIGVHVYGDGRGHWLRGELEDVDEEKFLVDFTPSSPGIDWTSTWRYLEVSLEDVIVHWGNPGAVLTFPITWKRIYMAEINDANKDSGTVFFDDFTASFIATDVEHDENPHMPELFQLEQNYPNPFNPSTNISFELQTTSHVRIDVHNTLGQRVTTLINKNMTPGRHIVHFDATGLASGVYLCRMKAGDFRQTRKMVFMK